MKLTSISTFAGLALTYFVAAGEERVPEEEVSRKPMGAYEPSDPNDDGQLQMAALFAVQELKHAKADSYSFVEKLPVVDGHVSTSDNDDDSFQTVVLQSQQQVVAGINYRMTIGIMEGPECVGAFKCVVYDRFGDMTVTKWGEEVSCEEAVAMMKNKKNNQQKQEDEPET